MASAACGRGTRRVLSGLVGNERVEINLGEESARAFLAVADDDVTQLARIDVRVERLDAAIERGGSLRGSQQTTGHGSTRLALAADRKSTRLNSSHLGISYAVFCLKKNK